MSLRRLLLTGILGGGSLPFSPSQISGLVAWYDSSYAAGLWEDSARTTQAADNADVIGAWDDRSGNGYHVTQATTGNKPTLRTSVQNGKSIIRFDGVDDFLRNTSFPDFGDNYTLFVAASLAVSADGIQSMIEVSTTENNSGFSLAYIFAINWRGRDATINRDVTGGDIRNGVFRTHRAINTGTGLQYWLNNSSVGTVAYTAPNPNTLNRITIGGDAAALQVAAMDISEILLYNTSLTTNQQSSVESYLNDKWAVY